MSPIDRALMVTPASCATSTAQPGFRSPQQSSSTAAQSCSAIRLRSPAPTRTDPGSAISAPTNCRNVCCGIRRRSFTPPNVPTRTPAVAMTTGTIHASISRPDRGRRCYKAFLRNRETEQRRRPDASLVADQASEEAGDAAGQPCRLRSEAHSLRERCDVRDAGEQQQHAEHDRQRGILRTRVQQRADPGRRDRWIVGRAPTQWLAAFAALTWAVESRLIRYDTEPVTRKAA